MSTTRIISGLSAIAPQYDAALVDIWGVIHDGHTPYMAAVEACRKFRSERGPVVLISNSPRPSQAIPDQLRQIGVPTDFYDAIATSGDATRSELAQRAPGPAFRLGPARDEPLYDGLGLTFAPLQEAAFISCTGLFDDTTETSDDYVELLTEARARGLEMVCANPDLVVQRGDRLIYCGGALAQAYKQIGGDVTLGGKPHAPIYRLAMAGVAAANGGSQVEPARVLAIGDGPDTDVAGAIAQGFAALFIAHGIHGADIVRDGELDADKLGAVLSGPTRAANYAALELAW